MNILRQDSLTFTAAGSQILQLNHGLNAEVAPSAIFVRTLSTVGVTVKGYAGPDDASGIALKGIDVVNLEKVDSVNAAGEYGFIVAGFEKVEIAVSGACTIVVRTTT